MAGVGRQAVSPSRTSRLQQLRLFVSERLSAAAEEIFGAVERTLLELENDAYVSMEAVRRNTELLTSAEALTAMPDTASQEREAAEVPVKQIKPELWDGPEYWSGQDDGTLLDLLNSEPASCLKSEQAARASSCFSRGDGITEEGILFPHVPADGYGGSDFRQPVSSEGEADDDDGSAANAGSAPANPKRKARRRPSSEEGITFFHCGTCGESFLRRSSMVMHARSHATGFVPLRPSEGAASARRSPEEAKLDNLCHVCGKTFTTTTHLKRHMMIHTGQRPHRCKECGKTFARGECLRIHTRIHTVERPYLCKVCPKSFRQRSNLVTHMRMHTGEKPYHCSICSQPFTYKKDMNKHVLSHGLTP